MASDDVGPFLLTEARRSNQRLNIAEHGEGQVQLRSRPLAVFVELTQNCNLRCPMCRSGEKARPEWNMSDELFDRVAEELFSTAFVVDLRGWGESTMLPHFERFVHQTIAYRPQIRLVTNGQISRPAVWDALMEAHAVVNVSCDAADPILFERLREGGSIARLTTSVRQMVEARDRHGAPRESVQFNTVVSIDNLEDLPEIVSLAASLEVGIVVLNPLVTQFGDPSHLRTDLGRTAAAYERATERAREEGVVVQLGAAPDPALAIPDMVRRPACMHPWSYAYVNYDGGVGFCDHLIGSPRFTFGSLRDASFEDIWNGDEWVELRKAHLSGNIPDRFAPCRFSYAQRYVDFEHLVHPSREAGIVSTATREGSLLTWRDPDAVPAVPWTPEMGNGSSVRAPETLQIRIPRQPTDA